MDKREIEALSDDRARAENLLQARFGIAHFYDAQWDAIRSLLRGERVLLIQKTGFGKSLCYQFPATLFDGVTVIFSPLIALMRDQVKSLNSRGIKARCINSEQSPEDNEEAINAALHGDLKILYIAPERQENKSWIDATRQMKLSMVVVDEAHTVSVWGHDFRPSFRRIVNLVNLLPDDMPVLATTATATSRVQDDIERQLGHNLKVIRGNLVRPNFKLYVIKTNSEDEKLIWLARNINSLRGTGLIYTGTRIATDIYSRWLQFMGINAVGYNAGLDSNSRVDIERGFIENRWKCIVSTNALGMGIDKPDIKFVIHTQIPASPIHYYQEIGRAGRDGQETQAILFFNSSVGKNAAYADCQLPRAFIENARPSLSEYEQVVDILKNDLLGEHEVLKAANIKQGAFRVIKADLIEQGIIKEVLINNSKKYQYQYNAPDLNTAGFDALRAAKLKDLDSMVGYVFTSEPRMKYLCDYLGDKCNGKYTGCDNTTETKLVPIGDSFYADKLKEFRESYFPEIKCAERGNNIIDGVAASLYGVSNVGLAIHRCKYEGGGDFPDFLLKLSLKAYRKTFGRKHLDKVMFVPPTVSGKLVENFAVKIAGILNVPLSYGIVKIRETKEQKIFRNAYLKRDNVKNSFKITDGNNRGQTILLVDDIYDSGATLKEIGKLLTAAGAREIVPLVIAKTVGNDLD